LKTVASLAVFADVLDWRTAVFGRFAFFPDFFLPIAKFAL